MRGRFCRLQLLLVLASAVILGSESRGTLDHILLSQIWDSNFLRILRLARLRWRYSTPPPHGIMRILVEVEVTLQLTISQSASFGVEPHLGLMTRYLLLFNSHGLVLRGAWVCHLYMLLVLASAVILGSESLRTRDHIMRILNWTVPFRDGMKNTVYNNTHIVVGEFTDLLPSNSLDIVFAGMCLPSRYQATYDPSRDRCIATVLHVIIYFKI
jgi:hypothetical protein